ncbi:MAG: queuosine precursor transporter, partial [Candidatus Promineifilaceae bacterium]
MSTKVISKPNAALAAGTVPRVAVIVIAAYIAAQMIADIASIKVSTLDLPILGARAVDMGTWIYPITFTLRDLVHKTLGKRNTRTLIITAAVINLFMVIYLSMAAASPVDTEMDVDGVFSGAYAMVFGPLWRIVVASIVAEVVSEIVDTEVYHWFVTKITKRFQWLRVLVSNAVSVPIDNAIFAIGAFAFDLPWAVVWDIFLVNLIVKGAVTLV